MKRAVTRSAQIRSIDEERRSIEAVASTEAVDSCGTVIRANWVMDRFNANPVLLWGHNVNGLPVGSCEDVRLEGKELVFRAVFDDTNDFDKQVWEKYRRGVLRGFSVRFNPIEQRVVERDGKQVIEYTRSELMEISCTPLPANPQALARAAGDNNIGDDMKKSAFMKSLRSRMDEGSDDEKKAAEELYKVMGGDDALKAAEEEETKAEGDGDDKEPESKKDEEGDDKEPESKKGARGAAPMRRAVKPNENASSMANVELAARLAKLEAESNRRAVEQLVDKHADRFSASTRTWALAQSLDVVESYVRKAPKLDLRAPQTPPATRGADQGTGIGSLAIPAEDDRKLDRMMGIRSEPDKVGYGEVDPIRGVRTFQAPSPGKLRAAAKGVK